MNLNGIAKVIPECQNTYVALLVSIPCLQQTRKASLCQHAPTAFSFLVLDGFGVLK